MKLKKKVRSSAHIKSASSPLSNKENHLDDSRLSLDDLDTDISVERHVNRSLDDEDPFRSVMWRDAAVMS